MTGLDELGLSVAEVFAPFVLALFILVFTLMFKDLASKIAKGMAFKYSGHFKEGDKVLIDNCQAIIVKIGLINTVIGMHKADGSYTWRYVPNERVNLLKIERTVFKDVFDSKGDFGE